MAVALLPSQEALRLTRKLGGLGPLWSSSDIFNHSINSKEHEHRTILCATSTTHPIMILRASVGRSIVTSLYPSQSTRIEDEQKAVQVTGIQQQSCV